jgi:hypothetical protein
MKQAMQFFATRSDLLEVFTSFERAKAVKYALTGMFPSPATAIYSSAADIENFGIAISGDQAQENTFLIAPTGTEILAREVPQRRGGVMYSFDQRKNPATIGVRPGGQFDDRTLICGQLGPSTESRESNELHAILIGEFKRRFVKIRSYFVGKDAADFLENGLRLTTNVRASSEYDLRL